MRVIVQSVHVTATVGCAVARMASVVICMHCCKHTARPCLMPTAAVFLHQALVCMRLVPMMSCWHSCLPCAA